MRPELLAFDRVAESYRTVRPRYPDEIYEAIEVYLRRSPRGLTAVEVGAGTGQATRQLATRGWHVLALEPGAALADLARQDLADFDDVTIGETSFETADIAPSSADLVAAATSWHWIDPSVGFAKARRILRDDGVIALWWNAHVTETDDVRWAPVREVYERVAPELAVLPRLTPDRFDYDPTADMIESRVFHDVEEHRFTFDVEYTTTEFLTLIDTYASHQRLEQDRRRLLHDNLTESIESNLSGVVTKPYEALLVLGRPNWLSASE